MDKATALQILTACKEPLKQYGVSALGLFGSTVRGESRPDSDVDILIDLDKESKTYDNLFSAWEYLTTAFTETKIDLVTRGGLDKYIGPHILKEVQYV